MAALLAGCADNDSAVAEPPASALSAICRPGFVTREGEFSAGTGFVMDVGSEGSEASQVLLTAHHLFGPDGGLEASIRWQDLPGFVQAIDCQSLQDPRVSLHAETTLAVPGAGAFSEDASALDVAAFPLAQPIAGPLEPATVSPRVGEPVWLLASVLEGEPPSVLRHRAKVVQIDPGRLWYEYENPRLSLQATSGAPIVDRRGRVVGINLGGLRRDPKVFGTAQPIARVLGGLRKALDR